ncbi:MAG: hypothetical protein H6713_40065 [Myxococcales bacterium]|nr:hypothetical protein [Myxococcales bacterium]MCB9756157.1 hypothetical protein [Myxococcales bacterium]
MAKSDVPSINDHAPDAPAQTIDGAAVQLATLLDGPTLLLFYRGWW